MSDNPLKWYRAGEDSAWSGLMLMTEGRAEVVRLLYAAHASIQLVEVEDPKVSLVEQVKAYARGHYDTGGWDTIIECWDDRRIGESLQYWGPGDRDPHECTTIEQVLENSTLCSVVSVWKDREADAQFHVRQALGDEEYERYHGPEPISTSGD